MRHITLGHEPNEPYDEVVLITIVSFEERVYKVDPVAVALIFLYFFLAALSIFCFTALMRLKRV